MIGYLFMIVSLGILSAMSPPANTHAPAGSNATHANAPGTGKAHKHHHKHKHHKHGKGGAKHQHSHPPGTQCDSDTGACKKHTKN